MKILHTADWHLDTPFSGLSGERRDFLRQKLLTVPKTVMRIAENEGCSMVLIAGDVFDGPCSRDSLDAVRNAFEKSDLPIFISPGNHDFVAPDGPWASDCWPENVHIFKGRLESVPLPELNCRVYGAGYNSMDCDALLDDFHVEGDEQRHIAVIHGDPISMSSPYSPVTAAQVRSSGLDYLALGHIHKAGSFTAGQTLCAWPGCPMGRGFDETGEKGLYIVDTDTNELRFVPLELPRFHDLQVQTGEDAITALEAFLPAAESEDIYRVTLLGSGAGAVEEIRSHFPHIPYLELRDERVEKEDIWAAAGEDTLEGVYFRMLREAFDRADEKTAETYRLAAEISRKLLSGREVSL